MKIQIPKFLKTVFKSRRNIWIISIVIVLLFIGFLIFGKKSVNNSIQIGSVIKQNLEETVLSTGQVVSGIDLALSFQSSGIVRQILVKEGDKVYKGQTLASLNQSSALATLTSAQGSLAQAQANYDKLINGSTQIEIQSSKDAVELAKVNLSNAYNSSLASLNNSYTAIFNAYSTVVTIYNNYFTVNDQEGTKVRENKDYIDSDLTKSRNYIDQINGTASIDLAISNLSSYLNNTFNSLQIIRNQCDQGNYYSRVTSTDKTTIDSQKTNISAAISNINTLQNSIASYKVALQTAENALAARQAKPRQEDIDLAKAQIISAQGQVDAAQAVLSNSIIFAPEAGTITHVDIKVGEQATPSKEVMILQDIVNLHTEANISEANVASLTVGQDIDYTFDALGPDQHFIGKVLIINPAATVISGVVDYLVKGSLENIPSLKPGMTANMTILITKKDNVLAVPSTAVINKNNKQYVRVIDNIKDKTYHEVQVQTGLQADGGLIEIVSGLSEGQKIIIYMKQ